jgi:hypothetical protein
MGLFKGMKDMASVTKQAKQLQEQQQEQSGYKPGMGGMMAQMGDMVSDTNKHLAELTDQSGDQNRLLSEGIAGEGVIVAHGTPERGAQWFNLDIDMEIHVGGRKPYRVNNQYMVPAGATLGQGVTLPVRVDPEDPAKIAIDWQSAGRAPARGEVRPAAEGAAQAPAAAAPAAADGEDSVAQLERLAKLRDSGALTDAEFEQQKARVLGS